LPVGVDICRHKVDFYNLPTSNGARYKRESNTWDDRFNARRSLINLSNAFPKPKKTTKKKPTTAHTIKQLLPFVQLTLTSSFVHSKSKRFSLVFLCQIDFSQKQK
jgi:hypothetical protein